MGTVDRALEAADGDGALAPVDIIPAQVDQLADPQAVQERHQRHHVVPVAVAVALQRRKQPVEFVLGERLALTAIGLGLDFPPYSTSCRPNDARSLAFYLVHSTFYIVT